jgi:hypothetical protein
LETGGESLRLPTGGQHTPHDKNGDQQRSDAENAVPVKRTPNNLFAVEDFGEQVAAQAHKQSHATMPLVEGREERCGAQPMRRGEAIEAMGKVPSEDKKCRERPQVVEAGIILTR